MATESRQRFDGRHVIVSGGGAGVGGAASELFAREGARVTILDIQQQVGEELASAICRDGGDADFVLTDVSDAPSVERAVAHAGQNTAMPTSCSTMPARRS